MVLALFAVFIDINSAGVKNVIPCVANLMLYTTDTQINFAPKYKTSIAYFGTLRKR